MSIKIKIEKRAEYLMAKFSGGANLQEIGQRFEALAVRCRKEKKHKLLIDVTAINAAPTFSDRYRAGESAVVFAEFGIKIAMVGMTELMDPRRLGELVAQNRGVDGRVFTDLAAAEEWLLEKKES
jgi:hypothetical protein